MGKEEKLKEEKIDVTKVYELGYTEKEIWKPIIIDGKETHYHISSYGMVKNTKTNKLIKQHNQNNGYYGFTISVKGKPHSFKTASLVAKYFIENDDPEHKTQVNHIDGRSKWNNSVFNLEWCTPSDNQYHAYRTNLRDKEASGNRYSVKDIEYICELLEENYSITEISEKVNVPRHLVYKVLTGVTWRSVSKKYDFTKYEKGKPGKKYSIPEETVHEICKLWVKGLFAYEISEKVGIPENTIYGIISGDKYNHITTQYDLKRIKIKPGKNVKYTLKDIKKVCKLLEKGKSLKEIEKKTSIPVKTIRKIKNRETYKDVSCNYNF